MITLNLDSSSTTLVRAKDISVSKPVTIIKVRAEEQSSDLPEKSVQFRLRRLGINSVVTEIGYEDTLPENRDGRYIIILDLDIAHNNNVRAASEFLRRLSSVEQRHLWTTDQGVHPMIMGTTVMLSLVPEIVDFPEYTEAVALSDDRLLRRLSSMFRRL